MGTLIENLNYIDAIKSDIRSAIETKGVDMTGYSFPDYPAAISQISGGGNLGYLDVRNNGHYEVPSYIDGWNVIDVNVPISGEFDELSITMRNYGGKLSILSNSTTYVDANAFIDCSEIVEVNLPNCVNIGDGAFLRCYGLTTVDLPACIYINTYAFEWCGSLSSISLPSLQVMWGWVFAGTAIQSLYLPVCRELYGPALGSCSSLEWVSLPECSYLGSNTFINCPSLSAVYLGYSGIVSVEASQPPLPSGQSTTFYVPSSLVSDYQADSIWGSYNIESLPS